MVNYKVGDEVVCIDAILLPGDRYFPQDPKLGQKCIVAELLPDTACVGFFGITYDGDRECYDCGSSGPYLHYATFRFIKLDKLSQTQDNEALA